MWKRGDKREVNQPFVFSHCRKLLYLRGYNFIFIKIFPMRKVLWTLGTTFSFLLLAGCSGIKEGPIQSWDTVFVSYTATYKDEGDVFEKVEDPIPVQVGSAEILAKIDDELLGMMQWETKKISITPQHGFGNEYDTNLVKVLPAIYFTVDGSALTMGSTVSLDGRDGTVIGMQQNEEGDLVTIDLNPSYTWKDLEYDIVVHQIGGTSLQEETQQAE